MKQLSIIIEHRNFNLNIQDEYYDELVDIFGKNINITSNNAMTSILSMCVKEVINSIDEKHIMDECINKINKLGDNDV
jgi:hypothetical protein